MHQKSRETLRNPEKVTLVLKGALHEYRQRRWPRLRFHAGRIGRDWEPLAPGTFSPA